jgi:hypothetical protein
VKIFWHSTNSTSIAFSGNRKRASRILTSKTKEATDIVRGFSKARR